MTRAANSNNSPQMNANEREYSAFHLRSLRFSRTAALAHAFAGNRGKSKDSPQMNANEREYSAFHLRSLRFSRTSVFAFGLLIGKPA